MRVYQYGDMLTDETRLRVPGCSLYYAGIFSVGL